MAVRVQGVEEEVTEASKVVADMAVAAVERGGDVAMVHWAAAPWGRPHRPRRWDGALDGGGGG